MKAQPSTISIWSPMDSDASSTARPPYAEMVGFAIWAPSVHNTQPWLWRTSDKGVQRLCTTSGDDPWSLTARQDPG
jgi:hypothetical protein